MASLYQRSNSPFWWIKWVDHATGKVMRESSGFRIGVGKDYAKAKERRAQLTLEESQHIRVSRKEHWDTWVDPYLVIRYAQSERTLTRAREIWKELGKFFASKNIRHPQQVTRQICFDYIAWRKEKPGLHRNRNPGINTVILELRILSVILQEAINRGWCIQNPCFRLGLKKTQPKRIKPEISDEEVHTILKEIELLRETDPDLAHFLYSSFWIALHQGCRLSETHLDLHRDIDLEAGRIFFRIKGGKIHETQLNPTLAPFFRKLIADGHQVSWPKPKQVTTPSLRWLKFLRRIGLPHLCFHSTRVTCISRMERAGASEVVVMRLVHHSSTTVHRVYRRLTRAECEGFWPSWDKHPSSASPDSPAATPETPPKS